MRHELVVTSNGGLSNVMQGDTRATENSCNNEGVDEGHEIVQGFDAYILVRENDSDIFII